ncbi:MAG: IMP dehydrogenase, partial [Bacteroidales bacterium]|nr:IMP dehydrogenase [Bacteroidales bacterium]
MSKFVTREIPEGLTFDDVLLVPAHSDVLPREVDCSTDFTTEIRLHTPIVSAAMDTVTEADLAIAMARNGGIGVIHKNMTIESQCEQVRRVKRAENGMIYDPVTIHPEATVGAALAMMKKNHIGGIPVVDANGYLIGIVTNRDLRFLDDLRQPVSEVMTKENLVTAPKGITLSEATNILRHSKVEKLPVVDKDGKLVGLITYKDLMKIKDNPIASKDSKGRLMVAAAAGIKVDTVDRIGMLLDAGADAVVLDTAHGHSEGVLRTI